MFPSSTSSRVQQQLLFHMLQRCRSMRQLLQLHGHLVVNGFSQKNFILAKLLSFCVINAGELGLDHASLVLRCVTRPSTTLINQMMRGYSLSTNPHESVLLYKRWCAGMEWQVAAGAAASARVGEVEVSGQQPNSFTYSFVLGACARAHLLREGEQVHARLVPTGFGANAFVRTNLINMYSVAGAMEQARMLFDDMPHRNIVSWNIMLVGYLLSGDSASAFEFFDSMPQRDTISWTSMIAGCAQTARSERALALFEDMQRAHVDIDQVTMVAVLSACADLGDLDLGRRIHGCVMDERCRRRRQSWSWRKRRLISLDNSLINMYAKCGAFEEAYKVFWEMARRDTVSWNTMIVGLTVHGRAGEALRFFLRMSRADADGERPDEVTLLAVLCACGSMGWVGEGLHYFDRMIGCGIRPRIEHYGCLVDMLSRAGLLAEAQELIKHMPMVPNDVVWGALVRGCIIHHRDLKLASSVVLHTLMELEEPDRVAGHLAALSNMYVTAMRWGDALQLRTTMTEMRMRKPAGCSWIIYTSGTASNLGY